MGGDLLFQAPPDIMEELDRIKQQVRGKGDLIVEALRRFLQEQREPQNTKAGRLSFCHTAGVRL